MNTAHYLFSQQNSLTDNLPTPPKLSFIRRPFALPAYHWVLIASSATLLVHSYYLPFWVTGVGFLTILLQKLSIRNIKLFSKRWFDYYKIGQLTLFFGGILGIWVQFPRLFSLDATVSFLLLCMLCKLWELKERRDAYVLLNLNLFVLAAGFLWTQDIIMAIGVSLSVFFVLFGFVVLGDKNNPTGEGRLKALAMIGIPALPLLAVLFLFFPRVAPLWVMPASGQQAKTGISDSMSPGDFSNLSKSTELAFRVEFSQAIPPRNQLYWRTMVFSEFDGVTWRPAKRRPNIWRSFDKTPDWANALHQRQPSQSYKIILETTNQNWLTALEHSRLNATMGLATTDEFTMRSYAPITEQTTYQANYLPKAKLNFNNTEPLSETEQDVNLSLPETGNQKSRALAEQFKVQSGGDITQFVQLIQNHIHNNNFRYTLSPPVLQNDRIDEFLFNTQAGFCEHYASSFVFLARSAGIPARVVTGYQGGEFGRDGKSWEVRQMDAHAWAEIWNGGSWQRIDPTGFVAPNRIEDGMDSLTNPELFGDGMAAALGYQQFRLMQSLRRFSDQASYYWQKNIINFDQTAQKNALSQLFNIQSLAKQLAYLALAFVGLAGIMMIYFWHRRRLKYDPLDLVFIKLSNQLGKQHPALFIKESEPVLSYLARLEKDNTNPTTKELLTSLAKTYRNHRFGNDKMSASTLKELQALQKTLVGQYAKKDKV